MEVDTLRTFLEVMRRQSFAAAAQALGVAPSSVSRTIAALEAELGVRLFNRTTRSLSPTEAALAYVERVEPVLAELESASAAAGEASESPRGLLRVTSVGSFAQLNVVPLLPEFLRRFPELRVELIFSDKLLDLVDERIDLAVRLGRLSESSLIAHRLCEVVWVACASPAYLRARGRPKTPRELERHDCLRYAVPGYSARWRFRKGGGEAFDVPVLGRVIANDGPALSQSAVGGLGIALLPRWLITEEVRSGKLVELFPDYEATASEFDVAAWMVYPTRRHLPQKVRVFADFLREKFSGDAARVRRAR